MAPILTYGSEIWAPYMDHDWKNWDSTPIERTHTQFLKRLLGVNRSTTNVMVRAEMGRHSLQERILKRHLNYIFYASMKNPASLVHQALTYEEAKKDERRTIFSLYQRHENLANFITTENPQNQQTQENQITQNQLLQNTFRTLSGILQNSCLGSHAGVIDWRLNV